jgi:peptide/nickel transport system substrate-binding protein
MLAEKWAASDDGLTWRLTIHSSVRFHDGTPLTATIVQNVLSGTLPRTLGTAGKDIESIQATSATELVIKLRGRLSVLPEALAFTFRAPGSNAGTGPFYRVSAADRTAAEAQGAVELRANDTYHGGRPSIDRIVIQPYKSVRSAWADMLRFKVDMLYEVGEDAIDLVKPSKNTQLLTFQRPYAMTVLLNLRRPQFKEAGVRRALNAAINRDEIVANGLFGHGRPADGPVWPDHWANHPTRPRFEYRPVRLNSTRSPLAFALLYMGPSYERLALLVQRQLQSVGVDVKLEETTYQDGQARVDAGNFDALLVDVGLGPGIFREQLFFQSDGPYNWGHYANAAVDGAFQNIRRSKNDEEYAAGVAAFQQAIVDDPPAIFLAWSERARAISTRFEGPVAPGHDMLRTMWQWRPTSSPQVARRN